MGKELVESKFPGHGYMVVTHTDTGKVHNHIVVSPWHSDTGKKIDNKKHHLYDLRNLNDKICQNRGLSVIDSVSKARQAKMPEKAKIIQNAKGNSWLFDLAQKADFARAYATSHDEYVSILGELGVRARVEDRNITYFYGSDKKGKRGSKLGKRYDKEGLEAIYRSNDEKFAKWPALKAEVLQIVSKTTAKDSGLHLAKAKLNLLDQTTHDPGIKDYKAFTKTTRPSRTPQYPHQLDVSTSIIPLTLLREARTSSIVDYCTKQNIALTRAQSGKLTLRGKEFVEISDFNWVNRNNRTTGSLIEFVAAYKNMTFLQAVADITGSKSLITLEKYMGESKRHFTSFYIPKEKQLAELDATARIAHCLTALGAESHPARELFKSGRAQVDREGRIRIFGEGDTSGALEFSEREPGVWHNEKLGQAQKPFFTVNKRSKTLRVYTDPMFFLKQNGKYALWEKKYQDDTLCLMDHSDMLVMQHLVTNRNIRDLHFVTEPGKPLQQHALDFFNTLKSKERDFGIKVYHNVNLTPDKSRNLDLSL
jgi:hypothetical protein